jgi:hypothetical protein
MAGAGGYGRRLLNGSGYGTGSASAPSSGYAATTDCSASANKNVCEAAQQALGAQQQAAPQLICQFTATKAASSYFPWAGKMAAQQAQVCLTLACQSRVVWTDEQDFYCVCPTAAPEAASPAYAPSTPTPTGTATTSAQTTGSAVAQGMASSGDQSSASNASSGDDNSSGDNSP